MEIFKEIKIGDNYVIREARRGDCIQIRRLIQDLADFLNLSNGPRIDAKTLEVNGFDQDPPLYRCLVVEKDSKKQINDCDQDLSNQQEVPSLIGYAFFFFTFSSWYGKELYLEDIYIEPGHQRMGIGTALFDSLVKIAVDTSCLNMVFIVIDGNPMNDFYIRRGAIDQTRSDNYHYYTIKQKDLMKMFQKYTNNDRLIKQ